MIPHSLIILTILTIRYGAARPPNVVPGATFLSALPVSLMEGLDLRKSLATTW